jgi:hypothetical protein
MTRRGDYIEEILRLFLEQPDSPATAKRRDWAVAADFYRQGIALDTIAYVIRLATVRRLQRDPENGPLEPIRSLAYYRTVLLSLSHHDLDPDYVCLINHKHAQLKTVSKARPHRQIPALLDRR